MADRTEPLIDAIADIVPRLLGLTERLAHIARYNHPPELPELIEASLETADDELARARDALRGLDWPDGLAPFRDRLDEACGHALRAAEGLRTAAASDNPVVGAYRALRHASRGVEALYPMAAALPAIGRYFLEPALRDDAALAAKLKSPRLDTGPMHAANETSERGGFSVYVPEYNDPAVPAPLIFALHGGSGHGRLFLWNWVREARGRGAIVVAPTSPDGTWSLMDPQTDIDHLGRVLTEIRGRWAVDPACMLLTGMSDGGTFTLLAGLDADSPFTHLAPVAASFHPLLLAVSEPERIRGLPVLLTHGARDWMFPVHVGRSAAQALRAAGAAVEYREIADLSHSYPRNENGGIMDWFLNNPIGGPRGAP